MEYLVPEGISHPFKLNNTGSNCYFNSTLQLLSSCTSFIDTIIRWKSYVTKTKLGQLMFEFAISVKTNKVDPMISANILHELRMELKKRKPHIEFGDSQDSAGQAIVYLLDMLEVPGSDFKISPLTYLFQHKIKKTIYCRECKEITNEFSDVGIMFNDFDPDNPLILFNNFTSKYQPDNYKCDKCKKTDVSHVIESLIVVPEIIIIRYNIYDHENRKQNTPKKSFTVPGFEGDFTYKLLGYIEHSGTLNGGHYWATCLRNDGVYFLNDNSFNMSELTGSPNIYLAIYHVTR